MGGEGRLTLNDWLLNISTLLYVIALLGVAPYLPRYAIGLGAGEIEVSMLATSYAITAIALRLTVGGLNDRGYARTLMISGGLLNALSLTLYSIASNLEILYAGRLLQGVSVALFIPASLYSASVTGARAQKAIVWRSTMWGLGSALGPALLGLILQTLSWKWFFYVAAATSTLSALLATPFKLERVEVRGGGGGSILTKPFILSSLTLFTYVIAYQSLSYFLPSLHEVEGLPTTETTTFFTVMALANLTARIILSLQGNFNPKNAALTGVLISIAGYTVITVKQEGIEALIAATLAGLGLGLLFPSLQIISLLGVPRQRRGVASSIYTAMFDLGALVGPPTVITIAGGYRESLALSTLITVTTLIPVTLLKTTGKPREQEPQP
jgi:ACDE family multidrug resistance protein